MMVTNSNNLPSKGSSVLGSGAEIGCPELGKLRMFTDRS